MGERLRTVREPIAWIVLLISTGYIALSLVDVGLRVGRDGQSWPAVGGAIGGSSLSATLVVAIVAAVLACLLVSPPTPRARPVSLIGAVLLSLASVLELGFTVLGAVAASYGAAIAMEVVGGVLGAGFKAALAAVLWRAWTQAPRGERADAASGTRPTTEPEVPELQRPTWNPDKAVGSSWSRAGDAATGASASTFGRPGEQSTGWQVPTEPGPSVPAPAPGGWVPPSQQALPPATAPAQTPPAHTPPAHTPWATASEAANGTPVVADGGAVSEPEEGSDQRPAPLWRSVDPDQPRQRT